MEGEFMAHQLPYLVNCSILFSDRPTLERPSAAKAAGFDAVEFWWPFVESIPKEAEVEKFVRAIEEAGVSLIGLNFSAGDMARGDRGLLSWPGRSHELRDSIDVALAIGERLGVTAFNALYGNRISDVQPELQDELAIENLVVAGSAAASIGAVVLIESISGAPRYPLLSAGDSLAVIERAEKEAGVENLGLLADLYHLSVNGEDLEALAGTYGSRISHVQIADAPGRHEPGTGGIELDRYLAELEKVGYRGWVGLEYLASAEREDTFSWLEPDRRAAPLEMRPSKRRLEREDEDGGEG